MPSYFEDLAGRITLLGGGAQGLRNSQIGAVSAVQAHFSLSGEPALIAMPTGSGKTAVLMLLCFLLKGSRVLVVTPSVIVRSQIAEGFRDLTILKQTGSLPNGSPLPKVHEVMGWLGTEADWKALEAFDVVVASPPSVSPKEGKVAQPPADLFDLVLVDEAHHEQAPTWKALLDCFPEARRVLCSATPFRNDRQLLGAKMVYHYPLRRAQQDGIFGKISFVPVEPASDAAADETIARKAQEVFDEDTAAGFDHRVMVRTSGKARADALQKVYQAHTTLRLEVIHSGLQPGTIKKRIAALRNGDFDGVICVDMMGEGFDFPNLKIAAIHAPHKSLPVTLQFIGRFARTTTPFKPIGDARFIAEKKRIQHDEFELYSGNSGDIAWHDIIADLSDRRVKNANDVQEYLDTFRPTVAPLSPAGATSTEGLMLGHLTPFHHVKVYQLTDGSTFCLEALPADFPVIHADVSDDKQVAVIVWKDVATPRWVIQPVLEDQKHHLGVVFFDETHRLLFLCLTLKEEAVYLSFIGAYVPGGGAYEVPAPQLRRVMTNWNAAEIYNIGMRNRQAVMKQESYRILTGSAAQHAISERDGQRFTRGHVFGSSVEATGKKTLGISSNYAKIWSLSSGNLSAFTKWCQGLAAKLGDPAADALPTPVDMLDGGMVITAFPDPVEKTLLMADWPPEVYHYSSSERRLILQAGGLSAELSLHPSEIELRMQPAQSTTAVVRFDLVYQEHVLECQLELSPRVKHTILPGQSVRMFQRQHHREDSEVNLFLDSFAPQFWYDDLSSVTRNIQYKALEFDPQLPGDIYKVVDWASANVNIQAEITSTAAGTISIQDYLKQELPKSHQVVFFDHDTGEAADFITLDLIAGDPLPVRIGFYHCKRSKEAKPGSRVDDMYEVLGQSIKCLRFRNRNVLRAHLIDREKKTTATGGTRYVKGNAADAAAILSAGGPMVLPIEIWAVQPGLDSAQATADGDYKMKRLIDNVVAFALDQGSHFKMMCS